MTSNRTRRALERMHMPAGCYKSPHAADARGLVGGVHAEVAARIADAARFRCVDRTFSPTRRSTGMTARRVHRDVRAALGAEDRP